MQKNHFIGVENSEVMLQNVWVCQGGAVEQSAEEQPIDLHTKKWKYDKFLSSVAFKVYTVGKF